MRSHFFINELSKYFQRYKYAAAITSGIQPGTNNQLPA
jgi:hypothetical protein